MEWRTPSPAKILGKAQERSQPSWNIASGCDQFFTASPGKRRLQQARTCGALNLCVSCHFNSATRDSAHVLTSAANGLKTPL